MTKALVAILLLFLSLTILADQNNQGIDIYLTKLAERGKLNGNVLVRKDGKVLYEKSFGYADGTRRTLLNKDFRFNLGSIYKEFPAAAIMQLQEKELLSVDDKLSKFLPDLPGWAAKVSINNLLQYSSGLPRINWGQYFSKGIEVTDDHLYNEIKSVRELSFQPGSNYLYSNANPILLIKIVEIASGKSFGEYLRQNIFEPFNMKNTVVKDRYPYKDKTLMAIPHDMEFNEDQYSIAVKGLLFSSTAQDISRWFEQLEDFKILRKQSVRLLSEKAKEGGNIQSPLGYAEWENDKLVEHSHHGSSGNYECIVRSYKHEGITIAILTNQKHENVHEISRQIYNMLKEGSSN